MFVHVRSVFYRPDRRANEKMDKSKATAVCVCVLMGDTSFDLLEFCFGFQSILGSWSVDF